MFRYACICQAFYVITRSGQEGGGGVYNIYARTVNSFTCCLLSWDFFCISFVWLCSQREVSQTKLMQTKYEASYEAPLTRLWTCRVHQRRHRWWQCLNFSKLRWIFSLKAISVLNWTNRISSWPASFVLWKLRLLFSLKHVLVLKVSTKGRFMEKTIKKKEKANKCVHYKNIYIIDIKHKQNCIAQP